MSLSDDTWIAENSLIGAEKLHALGAVSYHWNAAELGLKIVLSAIMKIPLADLWAIIHEMGDIAVCTAIRERAANIATAPVQEVIENLLDAYNINRINRNQLVHSHASAVDGGVGLARMKGPRLNPQPLPDDIKDIRRVSDEIKAMVRHIEEVVNVLYREQFYAGGANPLNIPALPGKLPLPEKLWKPPHPNPQGRKGQPNKGPG